MDDARAIAAALTAIKLHLGELQVELLLVTAERDEVLRQVGVCLEANGRLADELAAARAILHARDVPEPVS